MRTTALRWPLVLGLFVAACSDDDATAFTPPTEDTGAALDAGTPVTDRPATTVDTGPTDRPVAVTDLGATDAGVDVQDVALVDAGSDVIDVALVDAGTDVPDVPDVPVDVPATPIDAGATDSGATTPDVPVVGGCTDNSQCGDGEYCAGDGCDTPGECQIIMHLCSFIYSPVCGCNGMTYSNACIAGAASVRVASHGACDGGGVSPF